MLSKTRRSYISYYCL